MLKGGAVFFNHSTLYNMNAFSKKILSALVDIGNDENPQKTTAQKTVAASSVNTPTEPDNRFTEHFDKLFADANLPGPDYYEFSKMIAAMHALPDEKTRYCSAFAGLQVQGLDKQKLLTSIHQYLQLLDDDTTRFQHTVSATYEEKVGSKKEAVEKANNTIYQLSQQIIHLQEQITNWTAEIAENETKIQSSNSGFTHAMEDRKKHLLLDIEKINQYLL